MSQKTGIFIRTTVRTSNLANLFIVLFCCTKFLYQTVIPTPELSWFCLGPSHSNQYCCFHLPHLVQDSQSIINILLRYSVKLLERQYTGVLFNTGLYTITLFLHSNLWCHPFCSAHSHIKNTLYHSTTDVSVYLGNMTAVVGLPFISLIDSCIMSLYLHIVVSSVITENVDCLWKTGLI